MGRDLAVYTVKCGEVECSGDDELPVSISASALVLLVEVAQRLDIAAMEVVDFFLARVGQLFDADRCSDWNGRQRNGTLSNRNFPVEISVRKAPSKTTNFKD